MFRHVISVVRIDARLATFDGDARLRRWARETKRQGRSRCIGVYIRGDDHRGVSDAEERPTKVILKGPVQPRGNFSSSRTF